MSFMLTTEQILNHSKTVTRRDGWWNLKSGDLIQACRKCMGLKKGEHVDKLAVLKITSVRSERLDRITQYECGQEGFPNLTPEQFVITFCKHHKGCVPQKFINVIEFEYA